MRLIATDIRGDVSDDTLLLDQMPSISIDKGSSDYGVKAADIFWVRHGILRSTELRDSVDEQVIADILVAMIVGRPIERTREALDAVYEGQNSQLQAKFSLLSPNEWRSRFKWTIDLIDSLSVNARGDAVSLQSIVHRKPTTNPFPTIFSHIFLAIYQLRFEGDQDVASLNGLKESLSGIVNEVLKSAKGGMSGDKRQEQIDGLKGRIQRNFAFPAKPFSQTGGRLRMDFENALGRSQIETSLFEFKQGFVDLNPSGRTINKRLFEEVSITWSAMSNMLKPGKVGHIFIGVADTEDDANKISELDKIEIKLVRGKYVVGIDREAKILRKTLDEYVMQIKDQISAASGVDNKNLLLSNFDIVNYDGLNVIHITVEFDSSIKFINDKVYSREHSSTILLTSREIAHLSAEKARLGNAQVAS